MPEHDESFIGRWSRRKAAVREGRPVAAEDGTTSPERGSDAAGETVREEAGEAPVNVPERRAFEEIDIDTLDYQSDYTQFMGENVPDEVRNKALRKLWDSNPVFSTLDGLDDYIEDYTDEALAVPMGTLKTAYKVGQGFLTDEEAAEWDRLGRPPSDGAAGGNEPNGEPAGAGSVHIARESAAQPDVIAFLEASDRYHEALYPAESNHLVDVASLESENVRFLVLRDGGPTGTALGCGAVRIVRPEGGEAYGELKRMWIDPARRGGGLGRRLLAALETAARAEGVVVLRLETGVSQPEAGTLYRRAGFVERPPFGDYRDDPLSLFMEKRLD